MRKCRVAYVTSKRLFAGMRAHVYFQLGFGEFHSAKVARQSPFVGVHQQVRVETAAQTELHRAHVTAKRSVAGMTQHVHV